MASPLAAPPMQLSRHRLLGLYPVAYAAAAFLVDVRGVGHAAGGPADFQVWRREPHAVAWCRDPRAGLGRAARLRRASAH
eukprot:scaffold113506_cov33-Tisochrysis_lutea.AAC.3